VPDASVPVVVRPGAGLTVQGPVGGPLTFKVRGEQTSGRLTVFEVTVAPGDGPPLHVHANEDEAWYVLEGELRFRLGAEVHVAPRGSFVFAPCGVPHSFHNVGEVAARLLTLFTPSGMETFFDRFAALPPGSANQHAFRSLGAEAGMDVVGPPLAQSHPV
jgi:quercetin dioxygenase-like cupin family protein